MSIKNQNPKLLSDVIDIYVQNLELYLLANREKRFVDGNKYITKAYKAAAELRHEFGQEGRNALLALLTHPDSGIRLSVANDVLDYAEVEATKVLEEIENAKHPFESTGAYYCLKNWREGSKKFPGGPVALDLGK